MKRQIEAMETGDSRSEQVIEHYKRHKLAASAYQRIRRLLEKFEQERAFDRKLAVVGMILLLLVLGYLAWRFLSFQSVVIS